MQNDWSKIEDWTAAYDNRAAVPTHEEFFYRWGRDAAAYREVNPPTEIIYGEGDRERIDLFLPEATPRGLVVFVHGGWWSFFGREYFSHLAAGAVARGWAVAVPSYTLCPNARITAIGEQMVQAVATACDQVPNGPLVLCGHSAGGHLVSLLGCAESGLAASVAERLTRIVAISGVADLHPLIHAAMNETLHIDQAEARAVSPAYLSPKGGYDFFAWVGADELAEFRRQNALLASAFGGHVAARRVETHGENHFTVIAPLSEENSVLTRTVTLDQSG